MNRVECHRLQSETVSDAQYNLTITGCRKDGRRNGAKVHKLGQAIGIIHVPFVAHNLVIQGRTGIGVEGFSTRKRYWPANTARRTACNHGHRRHVARVNDDIDRRRIGQAAVRYCQ